MLVLCDTIHPRCLEVTNTETGTSHWLPGPMRRAQGLMCMEFLFRVIDILELGGGDGHIWLYSKPLVWAGDVD